MEYCSIYYTCCCFCVCTSFFFLFFLLLMLPHNLNFPKITSPPLCNDVSSLMTCLLVRGREDLSFTFTWDSKQQQCQSFNQFPMKNINSTPTFCLVQEAFHSDTHTNRDKKTIVTSVHHSNNHSEHFSNCLATTWKPSKHACEFCMITFSANVNK